MNRKKLASYSIRKSVPYIYGRGSYYDAKFYTQMFQEDLSLEEIAYLYDDEKKAINARIIGSTQENDKAKAFLGSIARGRAYSESDLITSAIYEIAKALIYNYSAYYELCFDPEYIDKIVAHSFTSSKIYNLPFFYLQYVPKQDNKRGKSGAICLKKENIWRVDFPSALGGVGYFKSVIKKLNNLGELIPEAVQGIDPSTGRYKHNFDFQNYASNKDLYILKITDRFGWLARDVTRQDISEYFVFYRLIQEAKAKVIIFNHVLSEINLVFNQIGIDCQLHIERINTLNNLEEVERELSDGNINFKDVYKRIKLIIS